MAVFIFENVQNRHLKSWVVWCDALLRRRLSVGDNREIALFKVVIGLNPKVDDLPELGLLLIIHFLNRSPCLWSWGRSTRGPTWSDCGPSPVDVGTLLLSCKSCQSLSVAVNFLKLIRWSTGLVLLLDLLGRKVWRLPWLSDELFRLCRALNLHLIWV